MTSITIRLAEEKDSPGIACFSNVTAGIALIRAATKRAFRLISVRRGKGWLSRSHDRVRWTFQAGLPMRCPVSFPRFKSGRLRMRSPEIYQIT